MDKQLSMFSEETKSNLPKDDAEELQIEIPKTEANTNGQSTVELNIDDEYEALDYQLADLMVELNDFKPSDAKAQKALNKTLRHCTLEISKCTREGQIAIEVTDDHQTTLLQTTVAGNAGDYMPLIIDEDYLYLNRYWQYQKRLADQINARIQSKLELSETQQQWANTRLAEYFPSTVDADKDEINWQKRAAEVALQSKFLIVSGGPGTGKTTTITRLLALLIEQYLNDVDNPIDTTIDLESIHPTSANSADIIELDVSTNETASSLNNKAPFKVLLAAPTGKAAIRMLDSMREASSTLHNELSLNDEVLNNLPKEANTIHKLLGYKHNSAQFKHNKNNPLNADVVLVDEASMIDIALMSKLVDAVPEHAKIILIGDKDQLSSVETGSVFADMCEGFESNDNSASPLVTLRKNWRFAADSDIGQCAIAANKGDSKTLLSILNGSSQSNAELIPPAKLRDAELIKPWLNYFEVLNDPNSSLSEIFQAFNQYRILNALRRGYNGSEIMNSRIETALEKQGLINRRRSGYQQSQSHWYQGRPIMITQNSYNRGLFNGDTGLTIIRDGEVKVYFPSASDTDDSSLDNGSQYQLFSPVRLPTHETTWAMTIHKSQGSEFDQVVLILPQEEIPLLTKQLVYTGITRAKKKVSIVATEEVLAAGVKSEVVRATRIASLLSLGDKEVVG